MAESPKHREHGRPRYQKGCQCDACRAAGTTEKCGCTVCTQANREYSRRNKRLKVLNGGVTPDGLPPTPGIRPERDPDKLVETRIQKALDGLVGSEEKFPDLAAGALAMGRLLDDPGSGPQHPGAVGQMRALMKDIRTALAAPAAAGGAEAPKKGTLTSFRGGRSGAAS